MFWRSAFALHLVSSPGQKMTNGRVLPVFWIRVQGLGWRVSGLRVPHALNPKCGRSTLAFPDHGPLGFSDSSLPGAMPSWLRILHMSSMLEADAHGL